MALFVEDSDESKVASAPVSSDPEEEKERYQYLRNSMIWMSDVKEKALLEARRLRSEYGSIPAEKIIENLSDEEYCRIYDTLTPWQRFGNNLKYQLFGVIMHHGSAYSGHYSAYLRDCLGEGTWKAPTSTYSNKKTNNSETNTNSASTDLPNDLCYILPRPGETLVKEDSPLNVVLTIVHTSSDGPTTSFGRVLRSTPTNYSNEPSIDVSKSI